MKSKSILNVFINVIPLDHFYLTDIDVSVHKITRYLQEIFHLEKLLY